MNKYKLVIFDLVDTLVNGTGLPDMTALLEQSLGTETVARFIDSGNIDTLASVDLAMQKFASIITLSESQEKLVREWLEWSEGFLFDDAIETLQYLKQNGYSIAIISNSPPTSHDQLANLQIKQYVDHAIFSFEVGTRKPEKEIFLHLLRKTNVNPSEAVMVGDSMKNDIRGAIVAGIDAVLLDRNNESNYEPRISSLLQLRDIL